MKKAIKITWTFGLNSSFKHTDSSNDGKSRDYDYSNEYVKKTVEVLDVSKNEVLFSDELIWDKDLNKDHLSLLEGTPWEKFKGLWKKTEKIGGEKWCPSTVSTMEFEVDSNLDLVEANNDDW